MASQQVNLRHGFAASWTSQLMHLYAVAGLGQKDAGQLATAFSASYCVVTSWNDGVLCGAGRLLSDGVFYATIFDVAVLPEVQGFGHGRAIVTALVASVPDLCIHLTSTFGNEPFYERLGFSRHKTAMALYPARLATSPYLG